MTGGESESDSLHFRRVLGQFATGVSLVTGIDAGEPVGLAVGSMMSVSLEPQLIAVCVAHTSTTWPRIRAGGSFCVNILGEHQEEMARGFAISGGDKFAGVEWKPGPGGSPVIDDVVAWVDCRIESEQEAGDHWLVVGRVLGLEVENSSRPLLFHRGGFGRIDRVQ